MNYDIWYIVGLQLDYDSLGKLFSTNRRIATLSCSSYFWLLKSKEDFSLSESEYDKFFQKLKNGAEVYRYFAGIRGIPIKGSERYGDLRILRQAAALSDNNKFLTKFFGNPGDKETLKILGRRNSSLIPQLSSILFNRVYIIVGAIEGNHVSLIKKLISEYPYIDSAYFQFKFLRTAIKSGSIEIIELLTSFYAMRWLNANSNCDYEDDSEILYYTCATRNLEMVKYIMAKRKCGIRDYNDGLAGAARAGNIQLMNLMSSLGATDIEGAMIFASKGGHLSIVLDMFNRGSTNLNLALLHAAKKGNQELVQKLVELGANVNYYEETLVNACRGNNLPVLRFLLSNIKHLPKGFLIRLLTGNKIMSSDILDTLLPYIDISEYPTILLGLISSENILWFGRMLEHGTRIPESWLTADVIRKIQLPIMIELIHWGLDYKKYIPNMYQKMAEYLLEFFGAS